MSVCREAEIKYCFTLDVCLLRIHFNEKLADRKTVFVGSKHSAVKMNTLRERGDQIPKSVEITVLVKCEPRPTPEMVELTPATESRTVAVSCHLCGGVTLSGRIQQRPRHTN